MVCRALSMGFPRKEYWSGLPLPPPGDLPDLGVEAESPVSADGFSTNESPDIMSRDIMMMNYDEL